jgi:general secretion pathway protein D
MLIKPEVSSISTWYGGLAQAAGAVPVVKSANAQTTVTIKDGVTIIIAGLVKDNKTKTEYKIPILGDLPVLGKAFKKISDTISRTETVVFLTPRIVTGDSTFLLEKDLPKPSRPIRD